MGSTVRRQQAESFVLQGEEPLVLRYKPVSGGLFAVRSQADPSHEDNMSYAEGTDYTVDVEEGLLRRTADSRIPDWSRHPLCGIRNFDHNLFPDYSNKAYTFYAEYDYEAEDESIGGQRDAAKLLPRVISKLKNGEPVTFAVLGDSISTGGEASTDELAFFGRFARYLTEKFGDGRSRIEIVNKAIGGEDSTGGAGRVEQDIVPCRPDLVTIGYGMNDQNLYDHGPGVPPQEYKKNIRTIIETLRSQCDCDIVLVASCTPNPYWQHTSGRMGEYVAVLHELGRECGIPVADAYAVWVQELAAGKTPESLLLNNINHPNDYGHELYMHGFLAMMEG
ncbi:SGNH/GDSL hydrolase family protein [Paenibacillus nasutitermitis]|uniref:SGNH hydrolase-type esterase domain-containing protein n=1 Tax=Paenibacillus nasutitermitis TaxID=1652958 RepID=A0A916ZEU1_9BACL|nr:SGNH/GDSL hydrolase family protein [Paenibacillus nasutitermitis]GGD93142.1 hypothetical protein GCM10010911_59670 [Paenibacillus nasutitermitis]